eukprot:8195426-Pyramimonas_sp.AAC.1
MRGRRCDRRCINAQAFVASRCLYSATGFGSWAPSLSSSRHTGGGRSLVLRALTAHRAPPCTVPAARICS